MALLKFESRGYRTETQASSGTSTTTQVSLHVCLGFYSRCVYHVCSGLFCEETDKASCLWPDQQPLLPHQHLAHLYITVEEHDMPAPARLLWLCSVVTLVASVRPQQQQVVDAARDVSGNREQLEQPLSRAQGARVSAGSCTQPPSLSRSGRGYRSHCFGHSY